MVHLSVVVPALPSGNVMVDVGEFGKFMITPALFPPSIVHRPVSPELRGVFAMIDIRVRVRSYGMQRELVWT